MKIPHVSYALGYDGGRDNIEGMGCTCAIYLLLLRAHHANGWFRGGGIVLCKNIFHSDAFSDVERSRMILVKRSFSSSPQESGFLPRAQQRAVLVVSVGLFGHPEVGA